MPNYKTSFNSKWCEKFPWAKNCAQDKTKASCKLCNITFSVATRGEGALSQHASGIKHKEHQQAAAKSLSLREHFNRKYLLKK